MKLHLLATAVLAAVATGVGLLSPSPTLAQERPQAAGPPPGQAARPGFLKTPEFPAGAFAASSTLARTTLKHEWVDIPYAGKRLKAWVEYPNGTAPAGVVIVMSHEAGPDDWIRAIADQLALEGFIAVVPDIVSGLGPGGGDFGSFRFEVDVIRATTNLSEREVMNRYRAAYDYARKLPRGNGKIASLGFGMGGADSFRFAAAVPELNAAVVFYGVSPDAPALARIRAPVLGLYGEDDVRVMSTVPAAAAEMKRLGKAYEVHTYRSATQAFMRSTVEGENAAAVAAAWPATLQFLRQHLN
jgi:carboxymethylenebutenolidase